MLIVIVCRYSIINTSNIKNYKKTKNKFSGSDETFKKIGESVDRLDRFFLN
jgi:hypothetical protein